MNIKSIVLTAVIPAFVFNINAAEAERVDALQYGIEEVVVTGSRGSILSSELPMTITVVGKDKIENRYESNLLTVINEQVPGFFNTSRSMMGYGISTGAAGGMNIRGIGGANSAEVLVLIDGHPQYAGLMGHPIADAYQSAFVNRVEVVRGPASVLYGSNAMGGVVNIITDKATQDGWKNNIRVSGGSYGSLQSQIASHFKKDRFFSNASLLYNRSDGHRANMEYSQLQGALSLGYEFSQVWSASATLNMADIESENPGPLSAPLFNNNADVLRGVASVSIDNNYKKMSGALMVFHNWGDHLINDGNKAGDPLLTYDFRSQDELSGINLYENLYLFEGNKITLGFDYMHTWGKGWFKHDDGTISSPWRKDLPAVSRDADELAGYINLHQNLRDFMSVEAGLRYNHHSTVGNELVPQVGMTLRPGRIGDIKLMVGKGYRNPTLKDLYLFPPMNEELLPEKLINYELSYSNNLLDGVLHVEANIFYINAENIILTQMVDGKPKNLNSGVLENCGFELMARYRASDRLSLNANYSYLHMENPIVAAPEHKVYVEADYSIGKWQVISGVQYIGGLYTNVAQGTVQDYLLWNARASYSLNSKVSLFARAENILGKSYEINAGFPMPKCTVMSGLSVNF